jgi:hypothetical protein
LARAQFRDTIALRGPAGVLSVPPPAGNSVWILDVGTANPITEPIYADDSSSQTLSNPLTAAPDGSLVFWLGAEREFDLVVSAPGYVTMRVTATSDSAAGASSIFTNPTFLGTVFGTPIWYSPQAITLSTASQPNVDHNSLFNLPTGNPHPQYLTQAVADGRYPLLTAPDPYPQYYNQARGDARYAQLAATDPFPQYLTVARGDARYLQQSTADARYLLLTGGTLSGPLIQGTYAQQAEVAKPANPAAGFLRIYPKSDHKLYILDSTGTETQLGATASNGLPTGGAAGQVLTKIDATNYNTNWTTPFSQALADARYASIAQGIPAGGTSGQVLAKNTATNYDVGWVAQSGGGGGSSSVAVYEAQSVSGTTVTLPVTPASVLDVAVNGQSLMATRDWTIATNVITFTTALSADDVHVEYMVTPFNFQAYSAHFEVTLTAGQSTITLPTSSTGTPLVTRGGVAQYQSAGHYSIAGNVITLGTPIQSGEDGRISVDYIAGGSAYLPLTGGTLTGSLLFSPDSTVDIGASASGRPRDLFLGRNLSVMGTVGLNQPSVPTVLISGKAQGSAGTTYGFQYLNSAGSANLFYTRDDGLMFILGPISVGNTGGQIKTPVNAASNLSIEAPNGYAMVSSRIGSHLMANAWWDGTNWNRYDVAQSAMGVISGPTVVTFYSAPSGANPITWTSAASIGLNGDIRSNTGGIATGTAFAGGWPIAGDLNVRRGSSSTGYVFLADTTHYIGYDGTYYRFAGGAGNTPLVLEGNMFYLFSDMTRRFYANGPTISYGCAASGIHSFEFTAGGAADIAGRNITAAGGNFYCQNTSVVYAADGTNLLLLAISGAVFTRASGLYVQTPGGAYTSVFAAAFTVSSTIRNKTGLVPLEPAASLSQVLDERVTPLAYTYVDDSRHLGFAAESMVQVVPEVVSLDDQGDPLGINYGSLVPVLWSAVRELSTRLAALENAA